MMNNLLLLALLFWPAEPGTLDELLQDVPATSQTAIDPGTRVSVTNSLGSVTITGGDFHEVRVSARSDSALAAPPVEVVRSSPGVVSISPTSRAGGSIDIDIRLPKSALLGKVEVANGDVRISGVEGDTRVVAGSGDVNVSKCGRLTVDAASGSVVVDGASGSVFVESSSGDLALRNVSGEVVFQAGSGDVIVQNAGGAVEGTAANGTVRIVDAAGAVTVSSISGDVAVEGATGRIQADTASGNVRVVRPGGDVEARTASGDVSMSGSIRPGGRFRLKSMSGNATVQLCGSVPGFTATLSSFSGDIQTDFELLVDRPNLVTRRLVGRYGDGNAQIEIEAFSGSAQLLACPVTGR